MIELMTECINYTVALFIVFTLQTSTHFVNIAACMNDTSRTLGTDRNDAPIDYYCTLFNCIINYQCAKEQPGLENFKHTRKFSWSITVCLRFFKHFKRRWQWTTRTISISHFLNDDFVGAHLNADISQGIVATRSML